MAKNHRGKGIADLPNKNRGKCPLCERTGIKLLYEVKDGENTIKTCKYCRHRDPQKAAEQTA